MRRECQCAHCSKGFDLGVFGYEDRGSVSESVNGFPHPSMGYRVLSFNNYPIPSNIIISASK